MPFLNLDLDYFSHPKTVRLVGLLGRGAEVLPIRLWCYCGKYHVESGKLTGYSAQEIESAVQWWGKQGELVEALLKVEYLIKTEDGFMVHDWMEHQGHLVGFKKRAVKAAKKRWRKISNASSIATSNAKSKSSNASSIAKDDVKQCPIPILSYPIQTIPNQDNISPPPLTGDGEDWRDSFKIYQDELDKFYSEIKQDREWIQKQERLNPGVDILLSIEKSIENYWGTEGAWRHKKKSKKVENIDWKQTFANAVSMPLNRVYKPKKNSLPTPQQNSTGREFIPPTLEELAEELGVEN